MRWTHSGVCFRCMNRTNIYLDEEQARWLDEAARAQGISRAALIRRLIDRGLEQGDGDLESDLAAIEEMTNASFPDWRQEITSVHGDESGGAFEWIGRGTLAGKFPIEIHGSTIVDIDSDGLVTRWRDYFDLKEIDAQLESPAGAPG